jgi:hypothetical protein
VVSVSAVLNWCESSHGFRTCPSSFPVGINISGNTVAWDFCEFFMERGSGAQALVLTPGSQELYLLWLTMHLLTESALVLGRLLRGPFYRLCIVAEGLPRG